MQPRKNIKGNETKIQQKKKKKNPGIKIQMK